MSPSDAPERRQARADVRLAAAWGVAGLGLAVAALLIGRDHPAFASRPPVVDLGSATPALLDTVSFEGRTVRASFDGIVEVADDMTGTTWLTQRGAAFPVHLGDSADVRIEDRLLVYGRLRGRGDERWLDAEAWTRVEGVLDVVPPDSVRFGRAPDRSAAASDRSDPRP